MVKRSGEAGSERRPGLHVSQLALLRVVLGVRLLSLVVLPLQEAGGGLGEHAVLWPGLAAAALYTIVLAVLSKRVLAFHLRHWTFGAIDIAAVFSIYFATGSGSSWPFYLFGCTAVLIVGLRGRVRGAVLAAVTWSALTSMAWIAKGSSVGQAFGMSSINDLFNLSFIAAIWAYSVGLMSRLNDAEEDLERRRETLERVNRTLDGQEKEIVGLLHVGNAVSTRVDLPGILGIAKETMESMGFGSRRLWLLREGELVADADDVESKIVRADDAGPLASAVRDRRMVSVRPGSDAVGSDAVPGVPAGTLAIVVPIVGGSEMFGAIVVESLSDEPFTVEDQDLLCMCAQVLALALRHARFYEQAQEQAVSEERHRLSVQMQEAVVGQVAIAIEAADRLAARAVTPEVEGKVQKLAESLRVATKDLRVAVLNWESLDWSGGATETARRYVETWSDLSGIGVRWEVQGNERGLGPSTAQDPCYVSCRRRCRTRGAMGRRRPSRSHCGTATRGSTCPCATTARGSTSTRRERAWESGSGVCTRVRRGIGGTRTS